MANTYTQIYMHVIFAVKGRESLICEEWQNELYRYMAGALKNREHTPYIINGTDDHVHLLIGMTLKESLSELVQSLKIQSTKYIKEHYRKVMHISPDRKESRTGQRTLTTSFADAMEQKTSSGLTFILMKLPPMRMFR